MRIKVYSKEYGLKQFLYSIGYYPSLYQEQRDGMIKLAEGIYSRKYDGKIPKEIIAVRQTENGKVTDKLK